MEATYGPNRKSRPENSQGPLPRALSQPEFPASAITALLRSNVQRRLLGKFLFSRIHFNTTSRGGRRQPAIMTLNSSPEPPKVDGTCPKFPSFCAKVEINFHTFPNPFTGACIPRWKGSYFLPSLKGTGPLFPSGHPQFFPGESTWSGCSGNNGCDASTATGARAGEFCRHPLHRLRRRTRSNYGKPIG